MGFYQGPYAKFGRLTYEMWRRDPAGGGHGNPFRWVGVGSRRLIIQANAGKNEHDITVEWTAHCMAGAGLAYKIGELKMQELRAYAKKELGENLTYARFHDELLGNGALPMDILEQQIRSGGETEVDR